jgi:hypothetical protein
MREAIGNGRRSVFRLRWPIHRLEKQVIERQVLEPGWLNTGLGESELQFIPVREG